MTKILLVEDDKSLREIYGVRLLAEGYDIISAGDGEEALAMAIKDRPALIVSDVMMPKISGFDMLDILRSTTETREIKVIMMTALSSEDQRKRGESLGADRYLVKSQVGIEDVVRVVHEVLGDAPVAASIAGANSFTPQPVSAPERPAPGSVPVAPRPQPQAEPATAQQPVQPTQPAANTTPQPQPDTVPQPQPAPATSQPFPQPTAPFSTQRPANLGDRIIHPLEKSDEAINAIDDLAKRMELELGGATAQPTSQPAEPVAPIQQPVATAPQFSPASTPSQPFAAPTAAPVEQPTFAAPQTQSLPPLPPLETQLAPDLPQQATAPTMAPPLPQAAPVAQQAPANSGLSFEETPRDDPATSQPL